MLAGPTARSRTALALAVCAAGVVLAAGPAAADEAAAVPAGSLALALPAQGTTPTPLFPTDIPTDVDPLAPPVGQPTTTATPPPSSATAPADPASSPAATPAPTRAGARVQPDDSTGSAGVVLMLLGLLASALAGARALRRVLHAWWSPQNLAATRFRSVPPGAQAPIRVSVLVPARHESAVLGETLDRLAASDHGNLQVLAIVGDDDPDTMAVARDAAARHRGRVEVVVDRKVPRTKSAALNTGLARATGRIVAVVDAESDVHPQLISAAVTHLAATKAGILQTGVQQVTAHRGWWALRACLADHFHYRSELHALAERRVVPLAGTGVFVLRALAREVRGWDTTVLHDADIGIRLQARGVRAVAAYDPVLTTREETPKDVGAFVRQRTRRFQGSLQTLRHQHWRELATGRQRRTALAALAAPFVDAVLAPVPLVLLVLAALSLAPTAVAVLALVPLALQLLRLVVENIGLTQLGRDHDIAVGPRERALLVLSAGPYRLLLMVAAARALGRELAGRRTWQQTEHSGAHRPAWTYGDHAPAPYSGHRFPFRLGRGRGTGGGPGETVIDHRVEEPPVTWSTVSTTTSPARAPEDPAPEPAPARLARVRAALGTHRPARGGDALVLAPLLLLTGVLLRVGLHDAPARLDVERRLVTEAYDVTHGGPAVGRSGGASLSALLVAAWDTATGSLDRAPDAVDSARDLMLVLTLVSAALLWVLARRVGLPRAAAGLAVALFALLPLAIQVHRVALSANLAQPWLLAAFVLVLSPSRRIGAFVAASCCLAVAALFSPAALLMLPVLAWLLCRRAQPGTRGFALTMAGAPLPLAAVLVGVGAAAGLRVGLTDGGWSSGWPFAPDGERVAGTPPLVVVALVAAVVVALVIADLRPFAVAVALLAVGAGVGGPLLLTSVATLLAIGALVAAAAATVAWRRRPENGRRVVAAVGVLAVVVLAAVTLPDWAGQLRPLVRPGTSQAVTVAGPEPVTDGATTGPTNGPTAEPSSEPSAGATTQPAQVLPTAGATSSPQREAAARAGEQLSQNPRLTLGPSARAALVSGDVDPRLLVVLALVANTEDLAVASFTAPGGGTTLRQMEVVTPDDTPGSTGSDPVDRIRALLMAQPEPYLAQLTQRAPYADTDVLTVSFPATS